MAVVARLPIWAFVDERQHAGYVEAMGAGHLPVLGVDLLPSEVAHLNTPEAPGFSYEAFQPPLYYGLAGPLWDLAHALDGTAAAARTIRAFDLLALAATVLLLWLLARRVLPQRREAAAAYAVALTFVAWPGMVFRAVTISNASLELPLTVAAVLALWIAWEDRSARALLAASVLCGLGLLCRLPFPPVVLVAVLAWRLRRQAPRAAGAAVAIPVVLLAPWLLDNLHRYGALTAASVVRRLQGPFFNPSGHAYGLGRLLHIDVALLNGLLPDEWVNTTLPLYRVAHPLPLAALHATRVAVVVLIATPLLLWLRDRGRGLWLLIVPLLLGLLATQLETEAIRLPLTQPRYVYPELAVFGVAAGVALVRRFGPRRTIWTASALTAALAGLWVYLSTVSTLSG